MDLPALTNVTQISLILGVAHLGKDAVTEVVKELVAPSARHVGEAVRDRLFKKAERQVEVLNEAAKLLSESGQVAQEVPGRILMPLLEYASWDDEPELQRKWSALLASAAAEDSKVLPAFLETLRQLTVIQARILDWVYQSSRTAGVDGTGPSSWVDREEMERRFSLTSDDAGLLLADLSRLRLVQPPQDMVWADGMNNVTEALQQVIEIVNYGHLMTAVELTPFGIFFMQACTEVTPVAKPEGRMAPADAH